MGARPGFDAANAFHRQHTLPRQKLGVFLGVNVVGDDGEIDARPKLSRELVYERRLARTHRTGNANSVRPGKIVGEHWACLLCAASRSICHSTTAKYFGEVCDSRGERQAIIARAK